MSPKGPHLSLSNQLDTGAVSQAFSEYTIDPLPLGDGGMKSAYRIIRTIPSVLKIVREPIPEDLLEGAVSLPERIRREIEAMKRVQHPRVVPVIEGPDIREIAGESRVWYIEPLYVGGTLQDRLKSPLPEPACVSLLQHLVDAAEALASHKIVHRDIKPSNIVFDTSGEPVLLDLGIAYIQDLTPLTDNWGQSPKTPMYAAPEQFELRKHSSIDFRTDLFQIGLVIFEALTGVHPFDPLDPTSYVDRLGQGKWDADALDQVNASAEIRSILRRLLAPAMSRRYRRFEHLHHDIGALQ